VSVLDDAVDKLRVWKDDWPRMVRECMGGDPDDWQDELLQMVPRRKRCAVKCSKGVGKSRGMAWCTICFVATRPHAQVAVTSISGANLRDGLWKEICSEIEKSDFLKAIFNVGKERIGVRGSEHDWFISPRTWSKDADATEQSKTLAGLHAPHMLFVGDEVAGYSAGILPTAEGVLATGGDTHLLVGGNATDPGGPLFDICTRQRDLWHVIEVNGDPDNPKRSKRVDLEWATEQIALHGRDNPYVKVNILNEFPPTAFNSLLGPDEVLKAMQRIVREDQYGFAQKRLGIDVARYGDDRSVIFPRQGLIAFAPVVMRGASNPEVAGRVIVAKRKFGSEMEFIDDTGGFGAGVIDNLLQYKYKPVPVNSSSKPLDPRYYNKRSEMHFEAAEWVKRGGSLPYDNELLKELTAPTYTLFKGKLLIEGKDQIKKRLGFSPDKGDAFNLTFALPDMPSSSSTSPGDAGGVVESNYNPFDPKRWRATR
jgi:phage terminase large subunit